MGRRIEHLELQVKSGSTELNWFRQPVVSLLIIILVVVIIVVVVVILSGLDALGHKVVPVTGDSGALGGVVKSAEHRLVELAGRLQVQSGLGLVVGPLRSGKEMEYSCFVLCRKKGVR